MWWGQVMCAAWLRFEREQGSLEDYDWAVAKVTPRHIRAYSCSNIVVYRSIYLSIHLLSCTPFYLSSELDIYRDTYLAFCMFRR